MKLNYRYVLTFLLTSLNATACTTVMPTVCCQTCHLTMFYVVAVDESILLICSIAESASPVKGFYGLDRPSLLISNAVLLICLLGEAC